MSNVTFQWRIQDFPRGGGTNPERGGCQDMILLNFSANCMKLKKIRPPRGGERGVSPAPPLDRAPTASGNQGKFEGIFPVKEKSKNMAFFSKIREF